MDTVNTFLPSWCTKEGLTPTWGVKKRSFLNRKKEAKEPFAWSPRTIIEISLRLLRWEKHFKISNHNCLYWGFWDEKHLTGSNLWQPKLAGSSSIMSASSYFLHLDSSLGMESSNYVSPPWVLIEKKWKRVFVTIIIAYRGRGIKESEKEIKIRIIIRTLKGKRGHKRGFVAEDWLERAPSNSPPFDLSGGHPCINTNEITN